MRIAIALLCSSFVSCTVVQALPIDEPHKDNRLSILLGQRRLDENDWEPIDQQPTAGIEYSRETMGSPVGFELGILGSSKDSNVSGSDVTGTTSEFYGGVRKTFGYGLIRPYLGAGLSAIRAEVDVSGVGDDDDVSMAVYFHGGIDFDITDWFYLGTDLRFLLLSDIDIGVTDADADYAQLALVLGFAF